MHLYMQRASATTMQGLHPAVVMLRPKCRDMVRFPKARDIAYDMVELFTRTTDVVAPAKHAGGRPREFTEEQQREKRRIKTAKWRAENRERSREITRESMKRASDAKAIAEGRIPGKRGKSKVFTEAEQRAKRNEKSKLFYARNKARVLAEAIEREQKKRDGKKAGTYVPSVPKRLTDEERKTYNMVMAANRRARERNAEGSHTRADIDALWTLQKGKCTWCLKALDRATMHVDHFLPLSLGGSNDRKNLRLSHEHCNLTKAAHHPIDHGLRSGMLCW